MIILSIDPGGTTGIAIKTDGRYTTCVCKSDEELWELFRNTPDVVIIENFVAELISKYGLSTVQLVGGVKALCWTKRIPLIVHPPQKRKAFLEQAKEILSKDHREIHEVDALAHLLAYEYWEPRGKEENIYDYDI